MFLRIWVYRVNHKTFATVYMVQIISQFLMKTLRSPLIKLNGKSCILLCPIKFAFAMWFI